MKHNGYRSQPLPLSLLAGLLMSVSSSQAYVSGSLGRNSTGKIEIEFEIVRGATASQPLGLASGKGRGFPEGSPARPRWLVQAEELSGGEEFDLCLPPMYEGGRLSLVDTKSRQGVGGKERGKNQSESKSNQFALKQKTSPEDDATSICGDGMMLQISLEPDSKGNGPSTDPVDEVEMVTMIISPE